VEEIEFHKVPTFGRMKCMPTSYELQKEPSMVYPSRP
jgi:hypothetical protein